MQLKLQTLSLLKTLALHLHTPHPPHSPGIYHLTTTVQVYPLYIHLCNLNTYISVLLPNHLGPSLLPPQHLIPSAVRHLLDKCHLCNEVE